MTLVCTFHTLIFLLAINMISGFMSISAFGRVTCLNEHTHISTLGLFGYFKGGKNDKLELTESQKELRNKIQLAKCSDGWKCDEDGCFFVIEETEEGGVALKPATEGNLKHGTTYGHGEKIEMDDGGLCSVEGEVGYDEGKVYDVVVGEKLSDLFTLEECMIVYNDENDPDDYELVCNGKNEDREKWMKLLRESDQEEVKRFLSGGGMAQSPN
jgi:hypothetical protein